MQDKQFLKLICFSFNLCRGICLSYDYFNKYQTPIEIYILKWILKFLFFQKEDNANFNLTIYNQIW